MNRLTDLMDFLQEDMAHQYAKMCQTIKAEIVRNPCKIENELLIAVSKLLEKRAQQQGTDDTVAPVRYLVISPLHSSLLTQSYEYSFMLMNEMLYLDPHSTEVFWRPPYIFDHIQQAVDQLESQLKQKFVGIKQYEISELRIAFAVAHLGLANAMIIQYVGTIEKNKNWCSIKRCSEVQLMLGGYLDTLFPVKTLTFGEEHQ